MARKDSNKKDIKDKIKKVVSQNDWLINVTKSMGFSSLDVVKELMPETSDMLSWNKDAIISSADMIKDIRNNNGVRNMFNKQLENLPQIKAARKAIENAKSDFKSGRFNNRNRELGLDDNGDFDFDNFSFDDNEDFMFVEDDGSSDETSNESSGGSRPPVTVINTMPLAKTIASGTEATINTMASIAEQNMAIESEKIMLNKQTFDATIGALGSINDNLALLVQFNSDSTAKYHAAALKYFEQSLEAMKTPEEEKKGKTLWNPFTAEGGLKLDEYASVIKENLATIKDENAVISSVVDFLASPAVIEGLAVNPLSMLTTAGMKKLLPKLLGTSLKSLSPSLGKLDKNLNSILPALLARINTFEGSEDPLLNQLNRVFGYKYKAEKQVDLGAYEKGPIPWDGESKKALVEVIPSYLRRIESVLTGNEERIYNYSTGKFTDIESIKKFYDDKIKEAEVSGYYSVKSEINDIVSQLGLNRSTRDQFDKDLEEYFRTMTQRGYLIDFHDKDRGGITTDEITNMGLLDYDPDRIGLLKRVLGQLSKSTVTKMATTAISDSREKKYKFGEENIANPMLTGYAYLHNDLDKDGKLRYNKKFIGEEKKDRFGLSQLDYLRDIRSALINGIKVFPDHRKRYGSGNTMPNEGILRKEKSEQEEYEKQIEREKEFERTKNNIDSLFTSDNTGRTAQDINKLSNGQWKNLFPKDAIPKDKIVDNVNLINDKVEDMVYQILFGEYDYREEALKKLKKAYSKGESIIGTMRGFFSDTVKSFKSFFTGQDYINSDGVVVKGDGTSIMGEVKKLFTGFKDKLSPKDGREGLLGKFTTDFMDGYQKFKVSLFGEKSISENQGQETFHDLMNKVKQRLPKALAFGYGGALVKTAFASNLGVLGSFLMPGGPLAAVLTGTTIGFLKQSETFNRYVFGEKDENGERVGGLISKAWQDKYKENKDAIKKGAGLGILASLFLPGGPVTGAILGIGTSIASKNEYFQEFLYGKDYKTQDKKSLMNGAFGKVFKQMSNGENDRDPKLAAFLGGTGLAVGIAQGVGFLPSMLLPGGPVMGAMLGLAGGITASSEKFQQFLFGDKDVDGKRYGGLLTQVTNWFNTSFMQPLKIKATEATDFVYGLMRKKIFDPIARSFEPIVYAAKNMVIDVKDKIVDAFTKVTSPIVEAFKEHVTRPLGKLLNKIIVNPLKKILGTTFKFIGKTLLSIATLPLSGIGALGTMAERYNEKSVIRQEKRRREKEYYKEHKDDGKWSRYYGSKAARNMTKEEEEAVINEQLKYRDGKTRRQRKKEQKGEYKDEMLRRKERLDEMKKQYEEDKKFAKENNYKYASKKQKEQREQELREKEAWFQEQQLMKAQDMDEKVSKISDNVLEFPKQTDKVVDKLESVQNTLKEGFNKLLGKTDKSNNVTPFDKGGDYGKVTDEDLSKIHNYLGDEIKETKPTEFITPQKYGQVSQDDLDKIHNYLGDEIKETKPTEFITPQKYGQVSQDDLDKIHNFIDTENRKEEEENKKPKLKDALDGFKLIDITKQLRDEGKSHADGLDKVPEDGYVAELHEGEMVVPEKPAGKLRSLMDKAGKGFSGLTDILSETSEDDIEHKDDDSMIEESLLKGTIKGFTGMMQNMGGIFGNIFGMMTGDKKDRADNALGLTEDEEDRLKEMEDRARYEHVSRKGVDYVQEQVRQREKEVDERKWRENLLSAIRGIGSGLSGAKDSPSLFDMLKEGFGWLTDKLDGILGGIGGLSSLIPALAIGGGVYLANQYQNSEEYKESRTDVDTDGDGEPDMIYDNFDANTVRGYISARDQLIFKPLKTLKTKIADPVIDGVKNAYNTGKNAASKVYNSKLGQKTLQPIGNKIKQGKEFLFGSGSTKTVTNDNVINFADAKAAKEGSGKAVNKVIKNSDDMGKVVTMPDQKLTKSATNAGSGKAVKKVVGETAEDAVGNKGLITKLIDTAKTAITAIGQKLAEKFPSLAKLGSFADEILEIVVRNSDGIIKKFAKKITTFFTRVTAGASSGMTLDVVFGVCDLVSGATAGNAGNLFGVDPENVDLKMRIISSVLQVVTNFNVLGIIGLINEILSLLCNYNFLRNFAIWIYNKISDEDDQLTNRITAAQIDSCSSIDEALSIMGITDANQIAMLKDENGNWKDFSKVENEELGGVISSTEQMELARLQYNLENGTKLGSQAFIDKESETLGSKIVKGVGKVFKSETAQQKINKLNTKAQKDREQAAEYEKKAEESTNFISKGYNKSMAWLNEKQAERREKKAEKKAEKAKKKKSKAEAKAAEHEEKAANSTGLTKKYHEWRAKKNKKKAEKYTLDEESGKVVPADENGDPVTTESDSESEATTTTEDVVTGHENEGYVIAYDENGNEYMKRVENVDEYMSGDAGMGEGEVVTEEGKAKKTGFFGKIGDGIKKAGGAAAGYYTQQLGRAKDGAVALYEKGKTNLQNNIAKGKELIGKGIAEGKEFISNPIAYTLNSGAKILRKGQEIGNKIYDKSSEIVGNIKEKVGGAVGRAKDKVVGKIKEKTAFLTEGFEEDDSAGTKAAKVVKNLAKTINEKKDEMINNVKDTITGAIDKIKETFTKIVTEIPKKFEEFKENVKEKFTEGIEAVKKGFKYVVEEVPKKIVEFKDSVKEKITEGIKSVKKKFDELKKEIPKKIGEIKDNIVNKFKETIQTVKDTFTEKINEIKEAFSKENMKKVFNEKVQEVKDAFGNFSGAIGDIFTDLKEKFKLPKLTMPDLSVTWDAIKEFFMDFAGELFKNKDDAGSSGPKPSDYIKPVQHNISSTELLKPMTTNEGNTTNNTMNRTNNKFVFYNQSDARWGAEKIGNRTMADAGCGPTSMAMAISQLTGEQITPDTIAKLGQEHLPGYSQYSLFPSVANKLNMNYSEGNNAAFIMNNLKKGVPVVLSGRTTVAGTPYTSEGHIVTASHIDGNRVYIQDPRGENYSKYYPMSSLLTGLNKGMILTPSIRTDVRKLSSGPATGINLDNKLITQDEGLYGDVGEYANLNMGKDGASQVTVADRVLSYARAFLANTSKFTYSQPQRLKIDNNGNMADCSSFVSHVLTVAGDAGKVAGTSQTFWDSIGTKVDSPQIGDVVCQQGHVGLYSGDGNYIHMSGKKYGIKESKAIQNGNNPHRGYKRVLKNPSSMVDPTITGGNSLLGTVVATNSGNPVTGEGATTGGTTTSSSTTAVDELGVFGKLGKIGTGLLASIYNGKDVFDAMMNDGVVETTTNNNASGGNVDISGESDTATAVWKFFTGKGYSNHATAGIMGNLQQESSMDPTKKQYGGGPGRGIAQWTVGEGRFKGLEAHAKSKGKDWTDLQSQLEWIDLELGGKDSTTASKLNKNYGGLEGFKKATDTKWAVQAFEKSFERAGKPNYTNRYKYADSFLSKFANAGAGDDAGGGFTMATSAETAPSSGIPTSMNGWAYYQQTDPQWQEDISGKKIGPSGCGMASHAMMLTSMFGKQVTPVTVGKWARANGHWSSGMSWSMPPAIADKLGLKIVKQETGDGGLGTAALSNLKATIKSGYPAILSGKGQSSNKETPFTSGGHIVLAVGVDGNGNVIINDPRGPSYTKAYTDDGMLNIGTGLRGYWAFDTTSSASLPSDWGSGDFTATPGATTGGDGTTTTTTSIDELGVFGKLGSIGTGLVASLYNGRDVFDAMMSGGTETTTTGSSGTLPVGDTTVDETLMLSGQEGFFKALGPSAAAAYNQYHIFPSTTLAQAALESSWGKSRVATSDKNLFGIKWTGNHAPSITVEKGLNCPSNEQGGARPYNRYKSFADSMTDHGWFLDKYDRYNSALAATTPEKQIELLGKSGYAEASTYGPSLQKMVDKYNLTQYNTASTNAGAGDGNTYLVSPKGDAGKGDGKVSYNKSVNTGINTTDVNAQRNLEDINRKINVAFNNINTSDPNAYTEILKLIMQELQAINNNTAATANSVSNIEIVSANTPINENDNVTTAEVYKSGKKSKAVSKLQTINSSTGYSTARQIAGYKK